MRFDSSFDGIVVRSESATDLNSELMSGPGVRDSRSRPSAVPGFGKVAGDADHIPAPSKPFGLGEYIRNIISFSRISRHITLQMYCNFFSSWPLMHIHWKVLRSYLLIITVIEYYSHLGCEAV
jgi:hypothetical protein